MSDERNGYEVSAQELRDAQVARDADLKREAEASISAHQMEVRQCDVCSRTRPIVGVVASGLTAYSYAICAECLQIGAEPEMTFEVTAWTCGKEVNESVHEMFTFRDGHYWTWDEWFSAFGAAAIGRLDASMVEYEKERTAHAADDGPEATTEDEDEPEPDADDAWGGNDGDFQ